MDRERIVEFLRRYRREMLAVAGAVLLLGLLGLRALRGLRLLAAPVLIGAILIVGWLLFGPALILPRISTDGPAVVRNGVTAVMVCGEKRGTVKSPLEGLEAAVKYAPEPGTGTWAPVSKGDCTIWYHNPPGLEQRQNGHERAAFVRACGREVLAEYRDLPEYRDLAGDIARGMRKDCGIFGPQAAATSGD